jgi:hypothetical protein
VVSNVDVKGKEAQGPHSNNMSASTRPASLVKQAGIKLRINSASPIKSPSLDIVYLSPFEFYQQPLSLSLASWPGIDHVQPRGIASPPLLTVKTIAGSGSIASRVLILRLV